MFSHPYPHLHAIPGDGARFPVERLAGRNPIADFAEFVYRHFYHAQWLRWAEHVWNTNWTKRNMDPAQNPFLYMAFAFEDGNLNVIQQHAASLTELKRLLCEEKDVFYPLRLNPELTDLLNY